ncbi:MAG: hypothetical protein AB7E79_16480 [Rhodospirillaceae bacterium]
MREAPRKPPAALPPDRDSSAPDWRARAARLFVESDDAETPMRREVLRRRAVAADNIAEAMEHAARTRGGRKR